MQDLDQIMKQLDSEYPVISLTHASRLMSTVRRMKREKELDLPFPLRTGFAVSGKDAGAGKELNEQEWEQCFQSLCRELYLDYPGLRH